MFNRNALLLVVGAALCALDATTATAQATKPKSSKRIPITKEAPEPAPPVHDTVTVYRTDTLRVTGPTDTVRTTNTITRVDTVIHQTPIPGPVGGLYLGFGAGVDLPYGAIRTVNEPGVAGQINLGWQGAHSVLGVRADLGYTQYADASDYANLGSRAQTWNGNLDLRLNIPIFPHLMGAGVGFTPYLLGGGSYIRYGNLRMQLDNGDVGYGPQNAVIAGSEGTGSVENTDWHDSWGWNAGGGFAFRARKTEMFVEARAIHFNRDDFGTSWQVPIIFGINIF